MKLFLSLLLPVTCYLLFVTPTFAIYDPLSVPNNKFGIHIISATPDEINPASELVNSTGGDWGYVTTLIERNDRDLAKWQKVFDIFREKHLIPLVRLATQPNSGDWKRPQEGEEIAWADFLNKLNWPTKNRYVIIYNEPNHAKEWEGEVDPKDYAQTLDKTITALKLKSEDFFVLNAGFDASAPQKYPDYADELAFLKGMNQEVPGIFEKLDGWASHSYPNPDFSSTPDKLGRGSVRTWKWELDQLRAMGVNKKLPVFITETGWKHSEGREFDPSYPDPEVVADYYKKAFEGAWFDSQIAAVTPFILSYQEYPFDHFSFKKYSGQVQNEKLLGLTYPDYYPQFQVIADLPKVSGSPLQNYLGYLSKGFIYPSIVSDETYTITLTYKNTGQAIWGDNNQIKLAPLQGGRELGIEPVELPANLKVKPGDEYTFELKLKSPHDGKYNVSLNLFNGNSQFSSQPVNFTTEVKSPIILSVHSKLKWKEDFSGDYILKVAGLTGQTIKYLMLKANGISQDLEAKELVPDLNYSFTLEHPFYKPKTIQTRLSSGENTLDFGELAPDISSAILKPRVLWSLLPFSN